MKEVIPVTVIIPCFRCKDTLERAIQSVAEQTVLPGEVILVDDYSNDGTFEHMQFLMRKYDELNIRVKGLKVNRGPAVARNSGWALAKMPYIAFLDADDTWHPRKLEVQYKYMAAHPEIDISGHHRLVVKDEYANLENVFSGAFEPVNVSVKPVKKYKALFKNPFSTSTVMLKRDITFRFDPEKYRSEDYLLWLTGLLSGLQVVCFEASLSFRYTLPFGEGGLSKNLTAMLKGNLDTYSRLKDLGLLTKTEMHFFKCFSLVKFIRRYLLSILYGLKK